jgi:hypothetical protein
VSDAELVVLAGQAGVGKTQQAAELVHARQHAGDVDVVFWIDATSRNTILTNFGRAAREMFGADDRDLPEAVSRVLSWLGTTDLRWMIVFDDLRDLNDMHDLWPPRSQRGRVIVTTQRRDAAVRALGGRHFIEVRPFTPSEATAFLIERLAGRPQQARDAAALASALHGHPLGLAQAAAYIADNPDLTCASYRDLFADRLRTLRQLQPDLLPDGYHNTVTATLSLSIDRANRSAPRRLARALLALACLLDSHGIPETVFFSAASLVYVGRRCRRSVNADDIRRGLSCLDRFNLVTYDPDAPHRTVRVNTLVQRVVYEALKRRGIRKTARAAANALLQAWPTIGGNTERAAVLRANTMALRESAGDHLWHRQAVAVLYRAGRSFGESGQAAVAGDYFRSLLGPAHARYDRTTVWYVRAGLAHWRGEAGFPDDAEKIFDELREDVQQELGPDHPLTLTTRRSRVRWRADAGNPTGASVEMDGLVEHFSRIFGSDHPETLYARNIYGRGLAAAGYPRHAIPYQTKLVDDFIRIRGPDHPDTLSARNNLAGVRRQASDPTGAANELTELLNDLHRVLGPDDPRTLRTRKNLALCLADAGDYVGSIQALDELLSDCAVVLGLGHPDTREVRDDLARLRSPEP